MDAICGIEGLSFFDPYPRSILEALLSDNPKTFLLAEVQSGIVAGYCVASQKRTTAHLVSIAVLPEFRQHGIGTALIRALIGRLDSNIVKLRLEVKQGNSDARKLYERLGFNNVGLVEGYYADGTPAVVMQLALNDTWSTVRLFERGSAR